MKKYLKGIGIKSKKAFKDLKDTNFKKINRILITYNNELKKNQNKIIKENEKDEKNCKRNDLVDRLILNKNKIDDIRHSINEIINFKKPL